MTTPFLAALPEAQRQTFLRAIRALNPDTPGRPSRLPWQIIHADTTQPEADFAVAQRSERLQAMAREIIDSERPRLLESVSPERAFFLMCTVEHELEASGALDDLSDEALDEQAFTDAQADRHRVIADAIADYDRVETAHFARTLTAYPELTSMPQDDLDRCIELHSNLETLQATIDEHIETCPFCHRLVNDHDAAAHVEAGPSHS